MISSCHVLLNKMDALERHLSQQILTALQERLAIGKGDQLVNELILFVFVCSVRLDVRAL